MKTLAAPPLDLPRLVMRRAAVVALLTFFLAIALGLARADADIDDEVDAALSLAAALARVSQGVALSDADVIDALRAHDRETPLRHLALTLRDGDGRLMLGRAQTSAPPAPLAWAMELHRQWRPGVFGQPVTWLLPRPEGEPWTVTLTAQHDSERREALTYLASLMGVLGVGGMAMLAVIAWNVRRAFRPLQGLLAAISRIQRGEPGAARAIGPMPIRELQVIGQALQALGNALDAAEEQRRVLGQKVLTLQEDERTRIARELHDEFGQRLTAMRVDATWLARRLSGDAQVHAVLRSMAAQCEGMQRDIRGLLANLMPFGTSDGQGVESLGRLSELLRLLVAGWQRGQASGVQFRLALDLPAEVGEILLPRELALALYRISQEALTNVARHAQATQATLQLSCSRDAARDNVWITWLVCDDGIGIDEPSAAIQRGNGLAGIQERVWAFGGEFQLEPCGAAPARPGLKLVARIETGTVALPDNAMA